MSGGFAETPEPPYYAVIFTSQQADDRGYGAMAAKISALAAEAPGALGMETTRGPDGLGITISYWRDETSILAWKRDVEHLAAQRMGIERFYSRYALRVAKVERAYWGPEGREP